MGNTAGHSVVAGDSSPAYVPPIGHVFASWVFIPFTLAETVYWYVRYPTDEPWPYFDQPTVSEADD